AQAIHVEKARALLLREDRVRQPRPRLVSQRVELTAVATGEELAGHPAHRVHVAVPSSRGRPHTWELMADQAGGGQLRQLSAAAEHPALDARGALSMADRDALEVEFDRAPGAALPVLHAAVGTRRRHG